MKLIAARAVLPLIAIGLGAANRITDGDAWWSHIKTLADDSFEGRKAGSEGHRKAAAYVAQQFDTAGLEPGGKDGYRQPVAFEVRQIDESKSSLEIVLDGKAEPVELGREANLGVRGEPGRLIEAPAVFVGHGLSIPEMKINDLAGLDLRGKIAVVLRGAPRHVPGPLAAHAQSTAQHWGALRAAGAIGVASLHNPNKADIPWSRSTLARLQPSLGLKDHALVDSTGQQLSITINSDAADRFLTGSGHTFAQLLAADKAGGSLPTFPLKAKIRARSSFSLAEAVSDNVIGVLRGSHPELKNEYVVMTAHLDHLGVGGAVKGDRIYNGAMDNASGIATLIEVAKAVSGKKLSRSVVFAAVTGEEGGLMGSKYFANHPTVAAGKMVANINVDMFLPVIALEALTVYGLDESDLGPLFSSIAQKSGVRVERDPEPHRNIFIRSDQYSFIRRGIPALTFKFHAKPGSPEEAVLKGWLKERYHAPSDDLQQPVNIPGAVKFNTIVAAFLEEVANRPARPSWKQESFFKRYTQ
jgi:hypothetical protein